MSSAIHSLDLIRGFVESFEDLREQDPVAAECALRIISSHLSTEKGDCGKVEDEDEVPLWGETHFDRIRQLFYEHSNRWLSVSDIREATDIGRGAIAQVLYSSHETSFERKPHPNHSKMKLWRLTKKAIAEATSEVRSILPDTGEATLTHNHEVLQLV